MGKVICSIPKCGLDACMTVKNVENDKIISACPIHGYLIFFDKKLCSSAELVKIDNEDYFYQMLGALKADGMEFDGKGLLQFVKKYAPK